MTLLNDRPTATAEAHDPVVVMRRPNLGRTLVKWLTSTDHKVIGNLYLITSFTYFVIAGEMAMVNRAELAQAVRSLVSLEQ